MTDTPQQSPIYTYQGSAESARNFAGVIAAIQQVREYQELEQRSYSSNWNGVIEAILELKEIGGGHIDVLPPGWEIIVDPDTGLPIDGIQYPVERGQLWFDLRQGRLFIWEGDGWYQTNGADGLVAVQDAPPAGPPVGAFWYNTTNGTLYLYNGNQWTAVGGQPAIDTAALALSNPVVGGFRNLHENRKYLPDPINLLYQSDANHYFVECLTQLDETIDTLLKPAEVVVHMGEAPPDDPHEGQFWFDTAAVDLLIYYNDGSTVQWVPTSAAYMTDIRVTDLEGRIETLSLQTGRSIHRVETALENRADIQLKKIQTLENENIARKNEIDRINGPDLSNYITNELLTSTVNDLQDAINSVSNNIPSTAHLAKRQYVDLEFASVRSQFNNYASLVQLANVQQQIPDVSSYVTQQDIDNSVAAVTTGYIQESGGAVDGSLVLNNRDSSKPSLDFSGQASYSRYAMEFKSNGPGNNKVTFGTNDKYWEYAWQFNAEEDFCWKYGDQKILSVAKDGVACNKLLIGQFQPNLSTGRLVMNTIDVGQEIVNLKAEIASLKSQLNTHSHGV